MGAVFSSITAYIAPLFIIISPLASYGDQIWSIHRNKSSAGFSLDIPLIMLCASFLRISYYPGARYDRALLFQSFLMIFVQLLLLKVSLDNRPPHSSKGGESSLPFAGSRDGDLGTSRPYNFWQWRSQQPYWKFLLYLFIILTALELVFSTSPSLYALYSSMIGYLGLSIEAMLPVPQILSNTRTRSCQGFRLSVLASWIAGDMLKMFWFFSAQTPIPWSFKLCGIFQMVCDILLGLQYWMYGDGSTAIIKDNLRVDMRVDSGIPNASHRSA